MSKKGALVIGLVVLLLVGVAFAGNSLNLSTNALQGKNIGFVQLTLGTTYHAAMSDRFVELAKEYGANFNQVVSANRSAAEQLALAEDLIAKGVDILILNPVGDEIVPSVAALCAQKNVPLFCVDNTSPGEGYVYVGIDNFAIARAIGRFVADFMGGKAKMVYVRSTATDTGCPALRFGGIMGGISDQGEIKGYDIIDERYAVVDVGESEGMLQMEELLAANPQIDVVIAHHDAQALGALTAIRNAGRKDVKLIVGFDGELRMLEEIKEAKNGKNGPALA
ncbi:MAG TPA: sugar ABC transporter substrate-binding protein, partial [Mesotoga sp.]|nr:sugar ABC transporter substrate-binding protein [Mesotoga sp.]